MRNLSTEPREQPPLIATRESMHSNEDSAQPKKSQNVETLILLHSYFMDSVPFVHTCKRSQPQKSKIMFPSPPRSLPHTHTHSPRTGDLQRWSNAPKGACLLIGTRKATPDNRHPLFWSRGQSWQILPSVIQGEFPANLWCRKDIYIYKYNLWVSKHICN